MVVLRPTDDGEILVSVICITYNQEKYLPQTLKGFADQRTDFPFEVIIHDDASTDSTPEIVRQFYQEHSGNTLAVLQSENQYSKGNSQMPFLLSQCRGKYVCFCEGDDFWSDPRKIQRQASAMKANENCTACYGKVLIVDEKGESLGKYLPRNNKLKQGVISRKETLSNLVFTRCTGYQQFQFSGLMARTDLTREYFCNRPEYSRKASVGDLPLFLYLADKGDAFYMDRVMSCYRRNAVGSWNSKNSNPEQKIAHLKAEIALLEAFDAYSHRDAHADIQLGIRLHGLEIKRTQKKLVNLFSRKYFKVFWKLNMKSKIHIILLTYFPKLCERLHIR